MKTSATRVKGEKLCSVGKLNSRGRSAAVQFLSFISASKGEQHLGSWYSAAGFSKAEAVMQR
jgi:hypothetical protein